MTIQTLELNFSTSSKIYFRQEVGFVISVKNLSTTVYLWNKKHSIKLLLLWFWYGIFPTIS